jgi:GT2 family glycosyltransferase
MTHPRVTTIVVNWRLQEETLQCLRSLERLDFPHRIIVVDNGSGDGSAECIARHFPHIELITLPHNMGFGAACNRAIVWAMENGACEYVLLLNNDAVVHPRALSELVSVAQAHPEGGIFGPMMYYYDDPRTIWYAGARRRWGVLAAADTGRGQVDRGQFDAVRQVDYVFGAAMFVRRSVFERIGLFDEKFFLYLEDMDFCLRAQKTGFSLFFVPQARVWHKGSASTADNEGMRKYHFVKSTVRFARKHTSPLFSLPALVFWTLVLLRFIANDLACGDFAVVRSYWLGLLNGLVETRKA